MKGREIQKKDLRLLNQAILGWILALPLSSHITGRKSHPFLSLSSPICEMEGISAVQQGGGEEGTKEDGPADLITLQQQQLTSGTVVEGPSRTCLG